MGENSPLTLFYFRQCVPPRQGQKQGAPSPPLLHRKEREGLSPDWPGWVLLDEFAPKAIALLTKKKKKKNSVSSQCKFSNPASSSLYPASYISHQALADFEFFKVFSVVG
ncbi:unnamed protein product [Rangifer tarandus platyrhynchus]|uniref:Uncharacterized protein n=2 Tax=Rangifer tarandus platyrhynchus TaxID=3082113 RepID=A0ABN8ZYQ9_RANTA|nr:unnamed protein product [Rangifer tarandus platyrhynchus]